MFRVRSTALDYGKACARHECLWKLDAEVQASDITRPLTFGRWLLKTPDHRGAASTSLSLSLSNTYAWPWVHRNPKNQVLGFLVFLRGLDRRKDSNPISIRVYLDQGLLTKVRVNLVLLETWVRRNPRN